MQIWPGQPYPLGATFDGVGTNFSIFSEVATRVELCLFDENGRETRVDLPEVTALCWHGYLPNVKPGQRYGFRVHGPWAPEHGQWCNPSKLLLDPYAKAIDGLWDWNEAIFPYHFEKPEDSRNDDDSAPYVPKSVVDQPLLRLGRRPPPEHTVAPDDRVRNARQGVHAAASRDPARAARHVRRHGAPRRGQVPEEAGRDRGRAAAGPSVRAGLDARREGAPQLLGLQLDRLPRAAQRVHLERPARRTGPGVQAPRQDDARGRDRGDPRRRLQPHGRGEPPRADAVVQGDRQRGVLPAHGRQPPVLHGLHRHRQHAQHAASRTCCSC